MNAIRLKKNKVQAKAYGAHIIAINEQTKWFEKKIINFVWKSSNLSFTFKFFIKKFYKGTGFFILSAFCKLHITFLKLNVFLVLLPLSKPHIKRSIRLSYPFFFQQCLWANYSHSLQPRYIIKCIYQLCGFPLFNNC
jgi:hypothetical protein